MKSGVSRLGRHKVIWLNMANRSQNQGMLVIRIIPAASPPLCKGWLLVGKHVLDFEGYLLSGAPSQDSPQKGTQRARLHPPLSCLYRQHCSVVCGYENYVVQAEVLELFFGPEKLPLGLDSLCVTCFLEGTTFPLQCVPLIGHPNPSFDVSVKICKECFSGCNG